MHACTSLAFHVIAWGPGLFCFPGFDKEEDGLCWCWCTVAELQEVCRCWRIALGLCARQLHMYVMCASVQLKSVRVCSVLWS